MNKRDFRPFLSVQLIYATWLCNLAVQLGCGADDWLVENRDDAVGSVHPQLHARGDFRGGKPGAGNGR